MRVGSGTVTLLRAQCKVAVWLNTATSHYVQQRAEFALDGEG
jgi:hypothetical protein